MQLYWKIQATLEDFRCLQFLTLIRPDLSYSVNYASQFMHALTTVHLIIVSRILRYVKGTFNTGLHFTSNTILDLCTFSNVDWAGYPTTRKSTIGYSTLFRKNLISWCAKKIAYHLTIKHQSRV